MPTLRFLILAAACVAATPGTAAAQADRVVILVRHAEKADEPRADPPLTEAGRARADALAKTVDAARVSAVIVTPFLRTRGTAEPLARALSLTPIETPIAGGLAAHVRTVADSVRARPAGEAIVVVGHSNTIPAIIAALGGPRLPDMCETEYATFFVLTLPAEGTPRLIRAQYGAPDPPGADACDAAGRRME